MLLPSLSSVVPLSDYDLVRIYHPDSAISRAVPPETAHARFQAISAAYSVLTGKARRMADVENSSTSELRPDYHSLSTAMWKAKQRRRAELHVGMDDRWKDGLMFGAITLVRIMTLYNPLYDNCPVVRVSAPSFGRRSMRGKRLWHKLPTGLSNAGRHIAGVRIRRQRRHPRHLRPTTLISSRNDDLNTSVILSQQNLLLYTTSHIKIPNKSIGPCHRCKYIGASRHYLTNA